MAGRSSLASTRQYAVSTGAETPRNAKTSLTWKISRGAKSADFVEFRPSSLHALRANVALLRLRDRTRIFKRDALPFAAALDADSYDVAFADPPYGSRMLDRVIESWRATRFSRVLAVEHDRTHDLPAGARRDTFEDTAVTIYRV